MEEYAQKPRIALLEFMLSQDQLFTFVVRADWPEQRIPDAAPLVFTTQLPRSELKALADELARMVYQFGHGQQQADEIDLANFYQLGERIFTPALLDCLAGYQALYLVPFGELHHIPLHALTIQNQPLIDLFEIAYLPSASVLPYLDVLPRMVGWKPTFLAAGVDSRNEYPHFQAEARNVFFTLTTAEESVWHPTHSQLLLKHQVSRSQLIQETAGKEVIHLSTHGHFVASDPLRSGISLFAPKPLEVEAFLSHSEPEEGSDFFLSARDIIEHMPLEAELLVLSGCLTGVNEARPGDELIGLTRGLLYAGAKSLIVSLYPIDKRVTSGVGGPAASVPFNLFYQLWLEKTGRKSKAFQLYIQAIKAHPLFTHPFYWFSLIYIGRI